MAVISRLAVNVVLKAQEAFVGLRQLGRSVDQLSSDVQHANKSNATFARGIKQGAIGLKGAARDVKVLSNALAEIGGSAGLVDNSIGKAVGKIGLIGSALAGLPLVIKGVVGGFAGIAKFFVSLPGIAAAATLAFGAFAFKVRSETKQIQKTAEDLTTSIDQIVLEQQNRIAERAASLRTRSEQAKFILGGGTANEFAISREPSATKGLLESALLDEAALARQQQFLDRVADQNRQAKALLGELGLDLHTFGMSAREAQIERLALFGGDKKVFDDARVMTKLLDDLETFTTLTSRGEDAVEEFKHDLAGLQMLLKSGLVPPDIIQRSEMNLRKALREIGMVPPTDLLTAGISGRSGLVATSEFSNAPTSGGSRLSSFADRVAQRTDQIVQFLSRIESKMVGGGVL